MNYLQHLAAAFLAAHAMNFFLKIPWTPQLAAAVFLGAILADVDHSKTKIFKFLVAAAAASVFAIAYTANLGVLISTAAGIATAAAVFLLKPKHRSVTHSWVAVLAYVVLLFVLTRNIRVSLNGFAGYAAHLLLDSKTSGFYFKRK